MFDIEATVADAPTQNGMVGAFIANDRLYMVIYLAATPYYFDKHRESAASIIKSARLAVVG